MIILKQGLEKVLCRKQQSLMRTEDSQIENKSSKDALQLFVHFSTTTTTTTT